MMEGTGDPDAALVLASERTRMKMWAHISERQDQLTGVAAKSMSESD